MTAWSMHLRPRDDASGVQKPALDCYLCDFSCALQWQVTAFAASLDMHPNLSPVFQKRAELAVSDVMHTIENFRTELLTAAAGLQSSQTEEVAAAKSNSIRFHTPEEQERPCAIRSGNAKEVFGPATESQELANSDFAAADTEAIPAEPIAGFVSIRSVASTAVVVAYGGSDTDGDRDEHYVGATSMESCSYEVNADLREFANAGSAESISAQEPNAPQKRVTEIRSDPESLVSGRPSQQSAASQQSAESVQHFESELRSMPVESMSHVTTIAMNKDVDLDELALFDEDESSMGCIIKGVLNPNYAARLFWDVITMLIVLVDAMVLPFQIAYKDSDHPDGFDNGWLIMTTAWFTVDILVNFNTGYQAGNNDPENEPGKIVASRWRIARNYFRNWFGIDIVSTMPWSSLSSLLLGGGSSGAGQGAKLIKVIKFVRFMRLLRMLRLAKLQAIWERLEAKCGSILLIQAVGLFRVLFVMACICHWNACIWWIIGQPQSLFTELLTSESQLSWANAAHWTTIPRSNGAGEPTWTWLERSKTEAYVFCFYWTLGVMRTMPAEVTPVTLPERVYVMVFMFFAFSAFAICVAQITQTFFKFSERKRAFNDDMAAVRMYLRRLKAGDQLQMKVKEYMRHLFDSRAINARELNAVSILPEHVKRELHHLRVGTHLDKLPFFRNCSWRALALVSDIAEIREMSPGDVITLQGRPARAAWILMHGRLCDMCDWQVDPTQPEPAGGLSQGKLITVDGDCLLQAGRYRSQRSVQCVTACSLVKIPPDKFQANIADRDDFWKSRRNMGSRRASIENFEKALSTSPRKSGGSRDSRRPPPDYSDVMEGSEMVSSQKTTATDAIVMDSAPTFLAMETCNTFIPDSVGAHMC